MSETLPAGFAALQPFVERWAVADTQQRCTLRGSSTPEERDAFFATAAPMLDAALDHLDRRPLAQLSGPDERLMNLLLSLAHVALAVEIQGPDEVKSSSWRARMHVSRSTADSPPTSAASNGDTRP